MAAIAKLHVLLIEKMGKETTHVLVDYMDEKIQQEMKSLATKEDIADIKEKIVGVHVKIAEVKIDLLKWTFGLFFTLMLTIIGLYFKK
jgi:hypothetical protein